MKRAMVVVVLGCAGVALLSGCATKKFVREQVGATESRIGQRVDTQGAELRQTADRTGANAQAIETATQRLQGVDSRLQDVDTRVAGVDSRVTEVSALAKEAQRDAKAAGDAARETDRRFASRNKLQALETKSIYFDFDKALVRDDGMAELEEIARALKADPNAVVELQGYADPRGSDVYNYRLTRDRVEAVTRYLVQNGIELRRIHAVGMGKAKQEGAAKAERDTTAKGPQERAAKPDRDALAKSRRVDVVVLGPQS